MPVTPSLCNFQACFLLSPVWWCSEGTKASWASSTDQLHLHIVSGAHGSTRAPVSLRQGFWWQGPGAPSGGVTSCCAPVHGVMVGPIAWAVTEAFWCHVRNSPEYMGATSEVFVE
jgi:hypothetical protein